MQKKTAINYAAVVFYILLGTLIVVAVLYYLRVEPLHSGLASVGAWITARLGGVNLGGLNISKLITDNWDKIAAVGITAVPLGIAYIKSYMANQATKKELASALELSSSKDAIINGTKTKAQEEIALLNQKIKKLEADDQVPEMQRIISQLSSEKQTLTARYQELAQLKSGLTEDRVKKIFEEMNRVK